MTPIQKHDPDDDRATRLEQLAEGKDPGFFVEFWHFLRHHRKWWMVPIILVLMALALLMLAGGTGAAPFIYSLF